MAEHRVETEQNPAGAGSMDFGPGLAGSISSDQDLNVSRSGALLMKSGRDLTVSYGGGPVLVAGGNSTVTNGGSQLMVAGGNVDITNGGAQTMIVGGNATLRKGLAFAVIARQVNLEEGSRVMLNTQQALIFGMAFGVVMGLMSWLNPRRTRR